MIIRRIEEEELWRDLGEKNFTAWVKNFSLKSGIHESIIWNRKKAGKVYMEYQKTKAEQGIEVPKIEDANVAVETLVLLGRINKDAPELVDKEINREITREDLRNAYKTVKKEKKIKKTIQIQKRKLRIKI